MRASARAVPFIELRFSLASGLPLRRARSDIHSHSNQRRHDSTVASWAIGAVTLTSSLPFPLGYFAGLVVWAVAVYGFLKVPPARATVMLGYLAVVSAVTRLIVLGVLSALRAPTTGPGERRSLRAGATANPFQ